MDKKNKLHPRNKHKDGYDFSCLLKKSPELKKYTRSNPTGQTTIDFKDVQAVRALNRALLKSYYDISFWDIPDNYLCPPIPGRVDYIHYLADLLSSNNKRKIPYGHNIKVLDIGTGANLVYPITGQSEYGWHFTGVDIDPIAIKAAKKICHSNKLDVKLKLQSKRHNIFTGIIGSEDFFHLTMCNPPFHASQDAAKKGTKRKWKNLGHGKSAKLNFGGQNAELWCPGGELKFISNMMKESCEFSKQCVWFTSLVSKKENLKPLQAMLNKMNITDVKIINMAQGQKISRLIAWSFMKKKQRDLLLYQQKD